MASKENGSVREKLSATLFRSNWMKVVTVMSCLIVFITTYALVLPAITMSSQDANCGFEEHEHTAECYDAENNLVCGLTEHTHTLACYSDPNADIENWDEWLAGIPELTGDRNADIVAVAASQVGYRESDNNYLVNDENQTQGYTRYGQWYGDVIDGSGERLPNGLSEYAYADWDAIFVSFVLDQAGVSEFGSDIDAGNWAGALIGSDLYQDAADYTPKAGDLIFFTPEAGANVQVGIITDVNKGFLGIFGNKLHSFSVIIGNSNNSVEDIRVAVDNQKDGDITFESIHGYGVIPSEEEAMDYSVTEEVVESTIDDFDIEQTVPGDETIAEQEAAEIEQPDQVAVSENKSTEAPVAAEGENYVTEQTELPADESVAAQAVVPADESAATQAVVPADESGAEQAVVPADETVAEQAAASDGESVAEQEAVISDESVAEEAVAGAKDKKEQDEYVAPSLAEDTEHIIGKGEEDLDSAVVTEEGGVAVSVAEYHHTDDGSAIIMNWQAAAQLEEDVLPAGAIIRVDASTGKKHAMTVAQAKSWGGSAVVFGENTALVDNDNYEITFIGDNGNLYTWADVQNMSDEAVVAFTGIHVKVLKDVTGAAGNNSIDFAFETTAKIADANVGLNYYVTRVSVDGKTGTETFIYKNGEAVPADQDRVLQDAGLNSNPDIKELTVKKSDYAVTMSYGPEAEVPEGAKLYVKEIRKGTEEYNAYIEEAKAALGINGIDEAELLGRFFDIKIMTKDGEFEPKAPVNVNIEYRDAIETEDASYVSAVHFSEDGAESIPVDTTDISVAKDEMAKVKAVEFSAESFSVYGVVYTVDFTYKGRTWSFPGRGNYNLNELLGVIGIDVPDEGVENLMLSLVKGDSIEGALYLTEEEDGWHISSDNPFTSTYVLSFDIGSTHYSLTVTDAVQTTNLNDLVTNFQISGAEPNGDGTYTVKPGKQYSMDITFAESESTFQFSDNKMTLTIPSGLELKTVNSPFNITVNYLGNNIVIPGNTATIEGGNLCIQLDTGDPNYSKLAAITTAQIKVHATGEFNKTGSEHDITIPGGGTYHVDESPDVSITKSARITDFDNGTIEYVLKLTSKGSNNGVTVKDTLEGTALTGYNTSSVKLYRNGSEVSGYSTSFGNDNKSFEMHTPALQDGEYEIRYKVNLNKNGLTQDGNGYGIPNDTKNTAEVPGKPPTTHSFNHIVEQHSASKSAGNSTSNETGTQSKTSWTITAYTAPLIADGQLTIVSDHIKTPGVDYDTTEKIQVRITDVATNTVVDTVELSWDQVSQLAPNPPDYHKGWSYDISQLPGHPNAGKYWRYDITYKTVTDMSHETHSKEIKNEGGPEDDQHEATGTAVVPDINRTRIEKSVSRVEGDEVTWRIKLTIPAAGVNGPEARVIEHLPSYGNGQYRDTYVDGSYSLVSGYNGLGTPTITPHDNGDVEFKWDRFPSSDAQQTVIFTFKTKYDPNWIADDAASKRHQNDAEFNRDHSYAHVDYSEPMLKKEGSEYIVENGEIYYDFDVKTNKISESSFGEDGTGTIEFTDQYDSHLEYVTGSAKIYGGDEEYNINLSDGSNLPVSAIDTSVENTIKFTLDKSMLPKKQGQLPDGTWGPTGELCNYYRLHYRMKVKNVDILTSEALQQNSLTVKMENSVTFNSETKTTTVEYTPNILDKWQSAELNSDTANHNGKVQFTIHVNEAQVDLEEGDVLTLYDQLTNISTAYQDIQITFPKGNYTPGEKTTNVEGVDEPVGLPYFNMKDDKITFYLPDGVDTIITYWAKPTGELGSDGKIHYTNTATLKGYEKKVEESADFSGEAVGLATQYGVNLYKADGYVNSKMLEGAEFKLFVVDEEDEDGNIISGTPLKDKSGKDKIIKAEPGTQGDPSDPGNINANGTIRIEGTWEKDGWNLRPEQRYYLLEVKAPEGYAIDTTKYSFTISAKGFTNYTRDSIAAPDGSGAIIKPWTFYNGDVLTVKDWPKKGELEITKNFDQDGDIKNYEELNEDQRSAISFEIYALQDDQVTYKLIKTVGFDQFTADEHGIPKIKLSDLPAGKYKVIEKIDGDDTCVEQDYSVQLDQDSVGSEEDIRFVTVNITNNDIENETLHSMTVTNKYEKHSEFKIHKYADQGIEGKVDIRLKDAEFAVYTVEGNQVTTTKVGENYVTNGRGVFSIKPGGNGIAYDTLYALKEEEAPDGFKKSEDVYYFYFVGENSTAPDSNTLPVGTEVIPFKVVEDSYISNKPGTTSVGVKKIWQNDKLEDVDKTDPVTVNIIQVAALDKEGKNVYSEEYYPNTANNEPIPFTATKNGENWDLSTEYTLPDGVNIVNGRLTGIPKIKVSENGTVLYYRYKIEERAEGSAANYVPTYKEDTASDGGTTVTITNRPNTVQSLIKLKAEKKWFDASGSDITDSMGVENNVIVDVYRKEGIVRDGIIREKNGDVKSAGDLFPIFARIDNSTQSPIALSTAYVIALPGDTIQIRLTPQNKTGIAPPDFEVMAGYLKPDGNPEGQPTPVNDKVVDPDTGTVICTYTAVSGNNYLRIKINQNKYGNTTAEVINLSAQGRTQILTQDDANSVGGEQLEELELTKPTWKAESKEYSGGSGTNAYSYYIVERNGKNYDAEYYVSGDTVVVRNTDTRLRVNKKWFRPDGETEMEQPDGEIVYSLYQVANGREWKDEQFTGDGPYLVDISEFEMGQAGNKGQNLPEVTFGGNITGIRPGSKVRITITFDRPNNGNMDIKPTSWAPAFNVTGGTVTIGERQYTYDGNNQRTSQYRVIDIEEVTSSIKLKGYMELEGGHVDINVEVLGEYDQLTAPETQWKNTRVGQVTMSYDEASIEFDPAFAESNIKVKPDKEHWTSIISSLPDTGQNGESYTYYIEEESVSLDSFVFDSIENNNSENGSLIVIKNKAKPAKVRVTKAFEGVENLPETFNITNSVNNTVFTVSNKAGGSGTASDPYYWEINDLVIGETVDFYEHNFGIENMEMTVTDLDGNEVTSPYKVTVTAVENNTFDATNKVGVTGFNNKYGKLPGALKFKKVVQVNGGAPGNNSSLVNGEYTFTVTGPDNKTDVNKTVIIKVAEGEAKQYKIVGVDNTFKDLPADKYVLIPELEEGDYTITETGKNGLTLKDITRGDSETHQGTSPVNLPESKVIVHVSAGQSEPEDASAAAAVFTNNREFTDFEFSKEWRKQTDPTQVEDWADGVAITAKLQRKIGENGTPEDIGTYVITKTQTGFNITKGTNDPELVNTAGTYTFKASNLLKNGTIDNVSGDYIYFVTEPLSVDNYKAPTYSNPPATPSGEWTTSDTGALNGGKIVNTPVDAFELPHTGGIGTHPYRTAGIIMVITALLGVFYMKRRENRHSA